MSKRSKTNILVYIASVMQNDDVLYKNLEYAKKNELIFQKIIFFLYGMFFWKYKTELFSNPDFRAWKYGIVELNYRKWIKNNDAALFNLYTVYLYPDQIQFIEKVINIFMNQNPWSLVDLSHLTYAWYANNKQGSGEIPIVDVKKSFLNLPNLNEIIKSSLT